MTAKNVPPCCLLAAARLAGTTYPVDRYSVMRSLGFADISFNSMDGVSDRNFIMELSAALSIIMVHLSRLAEEVIIWSSWEFKFIELSDAYSTGSSIMPQKKKSGRGGAYPRKIRPRYR